MEVMNLNANKNIVDAYGLKPTMFYDVEGTLIEKEGKNIKVEKKVQDKEIVYSLRLNKEIKSSIGENVTIDKDNITSMKIDEKKEKETTITVEDAIKKLGLKNTKETKEAVEYLIDNGIPVTKENVESFLTSKRYLKEIVEDMDFDSCIKLLDKGVDLEEDSLKKIAEALYEIKNTNKNMSIKELLNSNRKLSYKKAETIAKNIYGRKMGKDVYDAIIALHKEGIEIDKENIEKALEVIDKLYDLKDCDSGTFVEVFKEDEIINIETLYKYKNSYNNNKLNKNITSSIYEQFTVGRDVELEDISNILDELNIEKNEENIILIREFLVNEVEITDESFQKIVDMKSDLKELINIMDQESIAQLMERGVDPLTEEIPKLLDELKIQEEIGKNFDFTKSVDVIEDLENIKDITDKELLLLLKNEEDLKIENLNRISEKVIKKSSSVSTMFNTLGDLDSNTIALTSRMYSTITLDNLHNSHKKLAQEKPAVEPIEKTEENIIRQEYLNIKNRTTINLIRESIKDGVLVEHMPLEELNKYIDKKINKYRDTQKFLNEIKYIKGKEESIVPMVMKNNLNMSMKQINNINSILNNGKGIGNMFNNLVKDKHYYDEDVQKGIEILETKIKKFSTSLKEEQGKIKYDYNKIVDEFTDLSNSSNSDKEKDDNFEHIKEYIDLQYKLSKDDLILQLPISVEDGYTNINLIIPDIKKGIDKNNMTFYLNLNTERLGQVEFNLNVEGDRINIDFEADNDQKILDNKDILKDRFNKLGYVLKELEPSNRS